MKSRVRLYCYLRLYIPMLQQLSWLAPPLPLRSFSPRQICCCPQHVFQRTGELDRYETVPADSWAACQNRRARQGGR